MTAVTNVISLTGRELDRYAQDRITQYLPHAPEDAAAAPAAADRIEDAVAAVCAIAGRKPPAGVEWASSPIDYSKRASLLPGPERLAPAALQRFFRICAFHLGRAMGRRVWNTVHVEASRRIETEIDRAVWLRIGAHVARFLEDQSGSRTESMASTDAWRLAGTISLFTFFAEFLPERRRAQLAGLDTVSRACSGFSLGRDTAVLIRKPAAFHFDEDGRLHRAGLHRASLHSGGLDRGGLETDGPDRGDGRAIEYADGTGFYFYHGIIMPPRFIEAPDSIDYFDIVSTRNLEARRALREIMGTEKFARVLGVVEVDRDYAARGTAVLYSTWDPDGLSGRHLYFAKVTCPSTGNDYFLQVPSTVTSAREAVAWTFFKTPEEYAPQIAT